MSLVLHPTIIGQPHWTLLNEGDPLTALTQYYPATRQRWENTPFFERDGLKCRMGNPPYRRPVSLRAKIAAVWAALPKVIKYRVLRLKQT